jgi:uncharacterized protein YgbK (DUF1537 family)
MSPPSLPGATERVLPYPDPVLLGCIADDLTGATDLGGTLVREGWRVALTVGVPDAAPRAGDVDAVVVALKSRSMPSAEAVAMSVAALDALLAAGAERIYFKYASTFDSTAAGNIGPVTDALADRLDASLVVACPAFPENARTVVDGTLLVGGVPLADSPMRTHPLNPMTESSVVRLLQAQTPRPVGLVDRQVVARGPSAIRDRLQELRDEGIRHAVADAAVTADLDAIAAAVRDAVLVTGASALAGALVRQNRERVGMRGRARRGGERWTRSAVIAGSASDATRAQVAAVRQTAPAHEIAASEAIRDPDLPDTVVAWAAERLADGPVVIAAAPPEAVVAPEAGRAIERVLGEVARGLVAAGVRRLVVAGGETSGAVIEALGIHELDVGPEMDPGVPVVTAAAVAGRPELRLALKSGNFGSVDFFERALRALESGGDGA